MLDVWYVVRGEDGNIQGFEFDLREQPKERLFEGKEMVFDWGEVDGKRVPWLRMKVLEHAPKSKPRLQLKEAEEGESTMPIAKFAILGPSPDGHEEDQQVVADTGDEHPALITDSHTGMRMRMLAVADEDAARERLLSEERDRRYGELRLPPTAAGEEPQLMDLRPGARGSFHVAGRPYVVEVLDLLPNFQDFMAVQQGTLAALPPVEESEPLLPAVRVKIVDDAGDEELRWILQVQMPRDDYRFREFDPLFLWDPWRAPARERLILFAVGDELMLGTCGDPDSLRPIGAGDLVALGDDHQLRLEEGFARGTWLDAYDPVEDTDFFVGNPPSIRLQVETLARETPSGPTTTRTEEFVFFGALDGPRGQTHPVQYVGPDGAERVVILRFREDTDPGQLPVEWQSRLSIMRAGPGGQPQQVATGDIRVNDYFFHDGFRFFQTSHDPADPRYSGIGVVYDPGIEAVLAGFYMVMFGTMWVFLIQPLLTRKHRGTD